MVIIETSLGNISIELDHENTPNTAKNFLQYVEDGFYEGTLFHRVIKNFMIQGGGLDLDMNNKQTLESIENEADSGLLNTNGSVAMARTGDPHSATSQFFINVADNNFLNFKDKSENGWGYCVFAKVVDGMDVIEKITSVDTTMRDGHSDVPVDAVIIMKIDVIDESKES